MATYSDIQLELEDEDIYAIAKLVFDYPEDLLESILTTYSDRQDVIFQLVMSKGLAEICEAYILSKDD